MEKTGNIKVSLIFCLILSIGTLLGCAWIEVYNHMAGSPLPVEFEGKWRTTTPRGAQAAHEKSEMARAQIEGRLYKPKKLSEKDSRKYYYEATLRNFIYSWGLLRYLTIPFGMLLAIRIIRRTKHKAFATASWTCIAMLAISLLLTLYRGSGNFFTGT